MQRYIPDTTHNENNISKMLQEIKKLNKELEVYRAIGNETMQDNILSQIDGIKWCLQLLSN